MHASAQLKVIISGGFSAPYQQLLPEFERKSGNKVTTGSGASQGTGPQTIGAQLARGVAADVVILSREGLSELIAANRIAAGTDVDLAQVPLGVAVRAGAARPDVSTVEAFKRTLTNAKAVAMPGSTSGIYLMNDLFPRLGIAEKVNVKVAARGTHVLTRVGRLEYELRCPMQPDRPVRPSFEYGHDRDLLTLRVLATIVALEGIVRS
jgi:molybdate transport system substrate-binding protein